jgi:very-short-patch-repair endonuclease
VNVVIEGFEVDLAWLHGRVVVEVDGYEYHRD